MTRSVIYALENPYDHSWWFTDVITKDDRPHAGDILIRHLGDVAANHKFVVLRVYDWMESGARFDYEAVLQINGPLPPRQRIEEMLLNRGFVRRERHEYPALFGLPNLAANPRFQGY